jgi:hypothetical protein
MHHDSALSVFVLLAGLLQMPAWTVEGLRKYRIQFDSLLGSAVGSKRPTSNCSICSICFYRPSATAHVMQADSSLAPVAYDSVIRPMGRIARTRNAALEKCFLHSEKTVAEASWLMMLFCSRD